ncbi:hypothetical protein [Pseudomonas graminis]|uniref:Uncharacterized protein n=1 Tax=Pseudomonas graminis TaxID=158627 RepID=A0A1I0J013_9PSED|nr:hypothetical protein [Pseudomonas graminis]SEU03050.1 hypothetical protein SAMN05216197_14522 [Pseudomonas graminis]
MKIKALWGFVGNAALLGEGVESAKVKRGQVFEDADDEYAHTLIGKKLVVEVGGDGKSKILKPKETKPATPAEKKAAAEKAAAEEEANRLEAERLESERLEAERLEAEQKALAETK